MEYPGRPSHGPADRQPWIKKIRGFAGHQNSICWCVKRTRRVCTLKPRAVNSTGNRACPRTGLRGAARHSRIPQGPRESAWTWACSPQPGLGLHRVRQHQGAERGAEKAREFSVTREPRPAANARGGRGERSRRRTSGSQSGPAGGLAAPRAGELLRERTAWPATDGAGPLAHWLLRDRAGCLAGWLLGEQAGCCGSEPAVWLASWLTGCYRRGPWFRLASWHAAWLTAARKPRLLIRVGGTAPALPFPGRAPALSAQPHCSETVSRSRRRSRFRFQTPHSGHSCPCPSPGSLRRPARPRRTPRSAAPASHVRGG